MSNVLEFYLKMKDMMSSGLLKVAATSKNTFSKVKDHVQSVISKNKELEDSFDKVERKVKSTGNNVGGYLRKMGLAISLAGALSFAGGSVKAAMDYGATKTSFGVLTGSKQRGNDLANELNTLQQNTILGPEVFKAAQTMLSFGIETDKVVKISKQLGDVSMGNTDKFNALTIAYSQTQAAGRLMGQDLLQYINAGFNPLQTMSANWKEFGFKSAKTIGQLKEMMEKGQISSAMVAKAFEMATDKGGKFAGMMDAIAQTSYGKLQIMQGAFENFKIQLGNALMPAAEGLMSFGSKLLDVLNLSKSAPQILSQERGEINSLMGVITSLNEKNELRKSLLQQLNVKYPDLFKNIDIETVKNGDLLTMLEDINKAYDKRIGFATNDFIIGNAKSSLQDAQSEYTKYMTLVELMKRGDVDAAENLRSYKDAFLANIGRGENAFDGNAAATAYYQKQAEKYKSIIDKQSGIIKSEQGLKETKTYDATISDAYSLYTASLQQRQAMFGKDKKRETAFDQLAGSIVPAGKNKYTAAHPGMTDADYAEKLRNLMAGKVTAADINTTVDPEGKAKKGGKTVGSSIVSGGPRVINIHGVKFMDKLELHTTNLKEGTDEIERVMEEMFLRILNSGAAVQS